MPKGFTHPVIEKYVKSMNQLYIAKRINDKNSSAIPLVFFYVGTNLNEIKFVSLVSSRLTINFEAFCVADRQTELRLLIYIEEGYIKSKPKCASLLPLKLWYLFGQNPAQSLFFYNYSRYITTTTTK